MRECWQSIEKKANGKVDKHFTSPVVWPSPYACAQQYTLWQQVSGNHGEVFRPCEASLAWHSRYVFGSICCIAFETSQFIVYVIDFLNTNLWRVQPEIQRTEHQLDISDRSDTNGFFHLLPLFCIVRLLIRSHCSLFALSNLDRSTDQKSHV